MDVVPCAVQTPGGLGGSLGTPGDLASATQSPLTMPPPPSSPSHGTTIGCLLLVVPGQNEAQCLLPPLRAGGPT